MNWEAAIARNREALLEIILAAMASLGLHKNGMLTTLPFNLYRKALHLIRIAETAVRRLIFIAAHDLKIRMAELEKSKKIPNGGALSPSHLRGGVRGGGVSLQISGPKEQFETLFRRYPRATHPHISFPLIEPLKSFTADPRDFSCLNHDDKSFSRQPTSAFNLGNRLLAIHFALTNIDRQARRLLRWEARRDAALAQNRPHRTCPMRPGLPPFYARKPVTEIEKILKECHGLTHYARDNEAFLIRKGVP